MNDWQTGLYDCFDDWEICCYGCWCPACLYGENAVQIDGSNYSDACWIYLAATQAPCGLWKIADTRTALRMKYSLVEEPCDDCTVICWCTAFALCQEARELKIRGNIPGARPVAVISAQPISIISAPSQAETTEPFSSIQP